MSTTSERILRKLYQALGDDAPNIVGGINDGAHAWTVERPLALTSGEMDLLAALNGLPLRDVHMSLVEAVSLVVWDMRKNDETFSAAEALADACKAVDLDSVDGSGDVAEAYRVVLTAQSVELAGAIVELSTRTPRRSSGRLSVDAQNALMHAREHDGKWVTDEGYGETLHELLSHGLIEDTSVLTPLGVSARQLIPIL